MRKVPVLTGLALALGLSACSLFDDPVASDRISLTGLEIQSPTVDTRYPALISYEAQDDVRVIESCFLWSDAGPYCFAPEGATDAGVVRSMLVTGYAGTYQLEGYVRYEAGGERWRSEPVTTEITVEPRYEYQAVDGTSAY